MKPLLKADSLYKQFSGVCAVDLVSFQAEKGEIIALLGPNGAGKSTLMNMLAGLLTPNGGSIEINGVLLKNYPQQAKQSIGFLPEGAPMYGDMTVKAFLGYMADLKGLPQMQKQQRLQDVKEMAQIASVWDKKIETLSKGFQRRVGFAQSLLSDPQILLLDEPTDGLDPNQKEHIRKLIKQLGKHKVLLISTHLLDDVTEICTRILLMNNGQIIADGSVDDILKQSESLSLETAFRKLTGGTYA